MISSLLKFSNFFETFYNIVNNLKIELIIILLFKQKIVVTEQIPVMKKSEDLIKYGKITSITLWFICLFNTYIYMLGWYLNHYINVSAPVLHPVMKIDLQAASPDLYHLYTVLPLMDESVLVSNYRDAKNHVVYLSNKGDVKWTLKITDNEVKEFILLPRNEMLIVHPKGNLLRVRIKDGKKLRKYHIPDVKFLIDGIMDDENFNVLLVDSDKGELFRFNLLKKNKEVVVQHLKCPRSIDKAYTDQGLLYIVCETADHAVLVYTEKWDLLTTIGKNGSNDGELDRPQSARILPDNTIIVSDLLNNRISRFTLQGCFLGHLLQEKHGILKPLKLAVRYPKMWLSYGDYPFNVKCFQLEQ